MICPHCGDHVEDGYEICPSCGLGLYEEYGYENGQYTYDEFGQPINNAYATQEAPLAENPYGDEQYADDQYGDYPADGFPEADQNFPEDEEFGSSGFSQKTSIVALDPEFQKGTRIVANPMLDSSSRKRARVRVGAPQAREVPKDEMSKLIYDFTYAFGRMNMFEKAATILFTIAVFLSFAPWVKVTQYGSWISGYETLGLWVAISAFISGVVLLLKIGLRLPIWATLLHMLTAFTAAAVPLYLVFRRPLEGQEWMPPFYLALGLSVAAFGAAFFGAMRRFLN
ncbi:zinc ribbon domain-containing protein [Myxococcota bacterium]|nr:zinc ribbon domain-containing protein [Myxococcota bacterium]MBU1537896.1 zinc ribbon domain-containing protein [Myxococcota bacterium]